MLYVHTNIYARKQLTEGLRIYLNWIILLRKFSSILDLECGLVDNCFADKYWALKSQFILRRDCTLGGLNCAIEKSSWFLSLASESERPASSSDNFSL